MIEVQELLLTLTTFAMVFLQGIQQLNVLHHKKVLAFFTAYGMATAQVATFLNMFALGWVSILPMGTGGGLGIVFAMTTHKYFREKYS